MANHRSKVTSGPISTWMGKRLGQPPANGGGQALTFLFTFPSLSIQMVIVSNKVCSSVRNNPGFPKKKILPPFLATQNSISIRLKDPEHSSISLQPKSAWFCLFWLAFPPSILEQEMPLLIGLEVKIWGSMWYNGCNWWGKLKNFFKLPLSFEWSWLCQKIKLLEIV